MIVKKMTPSTVLITGASSGLGAALAIAYADAGRTLFLTGRNTQRLDAIAGACQAKGAVVTSQALEITDQAGLANWIDAMDQVRPIELVIANAGVSGGSSGTSESDQQTRRIFAANVDGVLNTLLPVIPRMQARKSGQIAIISSLAGFRGLPSAPSYSASKAAVRLYGEGLRGVLAKDNIGVTVITPGYIKTPMTDVNNFPMPFLMQPDKAAALIKNKLRRNPSRIVFPFPLFATIWFLSCLPPWLTDPLFARLPSKPADHELQC